MAFDKAATCAYNNLNVNHLLVRTCHRYSYVNGFYSLFFPFIFFILFVQNIKNKDPPACSLLTTFGITATVVKNSNLVVDAPAVSCVKCTLH